MRVVEQEQPDLVVVVNLGYLFEAEGVVPNRRIADGLLSVVVVVVVLFVVLDGLGDGRVAPPQ